VNLVFRSYRPHYFSHFLRKLVQALVNSSVRIQEIYEESFVGAISCYEIESVVLKVGDE
jgi:hypothetical protein